MKTALIFGILIIITIPALEAGWLDDWNRMQPIETKGCVCYRTTGSIKIDGMLSEDSWDNAPWTDDFADIQGDVKPRPRFRTRARMLWDDEYFYVGAELEDLVGGFRRDLQFNLGVIASKRTLSGVPALVWPVRLLRDA